MMTSHIRTSGKKSVILSDRLYEILIQTRSSAIADKTRALFCKVVEVLQDFLSENVDKKFTTDYNVA